MGGANLTFKDAHQMVIDELDKAYQHLREIHTDLTHLNSGSTMYKQARERFESVQQNVWKLKEMWSLF